MPTIEYYFSSQSPFTYMGNQLLFEIAEKHGCEVAIKPMDILGVWEKSGAVPPAQRPPLRQRYRLIELQRLSRYRGLPLNKQPKHFPTNPALSDHTIIAILESGGDPRAYMQSVFASLWVHERDIAEKSVLEDLLNAASHDAAAILAEAESDRPAKIRAQNTEDARQVDVPGAPSYVLNGEAFWGQDRLELLDAALAEGRDPFMP